MGMVNTRTLFSVRNKYEYCIVLNQLKNYYKVINCLGFNVEEQMVYTVYQWTEVYGLM